MIKEICQFVETIEDQATYLFDEGAKLKEGIYVELDIGHKDGKYMLNNIDKNGKILKDDISHYTKKDELTPFLEKCRMILKTSIPVSPAKIFNPNKKIFNITCNPFAIGFTKKILDKNLDTIGKEGIISELTYQYFNKAEEFVDDGNQKIWFEEFRTFIKDNFWGILEMIGYFELKDTSIIVFFSKRPTIEDFKFPYLKYLGQSIFNKTDFNIIDRNTIYGVSDSLSSFNDKKRFLQHQSASFRYNYRINSEEAQLVWKFYKLLQNKQLPNPLPIFVDKQEANLNINVVELFNNKGVTSYTEIIRSLIHLQSKNLQNFYLMFVQKGLIIDLDFVPVFKYNLLSKSNNHFTINEIFGIEPLVYFDSKIHNVFDFQTNVVNHIFNKQLVPETKTGSIWLKYFDELKIKPDYGLTDTIYNLIYKYRKAWYDFIYKSKQHAITMSMIDEMLKETIIDDLRHDKEFNKTTQIRKKLSLWFGLNPLFDNNYNSKSMANKTVELQSKIREIAQSESLHITTDDEFAFASGQLIWKLLIQSESSNRTHALLEPFLQKTDPSMFKQAIASSFNLYKYKFNLYPTKYEFDKLFSEVMGYDPDFSNMKSHLSMILAGYFSESIFKK